MNLESIIHAAMFTPTDRGWGLPLLFEGKPGVGKSSIITQLAEANGLPCETLIASLREPADFLGLPMPGADGFTEYAAPAWTRRFVDHGGVVFLDELNTAAPAVQAALLRIVLDGVVGEQALHEDVRFIAAQNATADAAGGWDIVAPLAGRFGHLPWPAPTPAAWVKFMLQKRGEGSERGTDYRKTQDAVLKAWPAPYAKAVGTVAGYFQHAPDKLMVDAKPGASGRACPRPRTWTNATRALASSMVHKLDEEDTQTFVSAFIGTGEAAEFFQWCTAADLPNPADVLAGTVPFAHRPGRLDVTMAVLSSCASITIASKSPAVQEQCWQLLDRIYDSAADVVLAAAQALIHAKMMNGPSATKLLSRAASLIVAVS